MQIMRMPMICSLAGGLIDHVIKYDMTMTNSDLPHTVYIFIKN